MLNFLSKYKDEGLLLLRLGIGFMFILHGYPKIMGGPEKWMGLGKAMSFVGITFWPTFWGFMAAFSEFIGGLLFGVGLLFRPACILLIITMVVAALYHMGKGDGFIVASHAIESAIVFFSMLIIGPGKYALKK